MGHPHSREYSAVIRTSSSFPLITDVIDALRKQSLPPKEIIVVDSKSSDEDRFKLREISDQLIIYPDEDFNFSKAINIGVKQVKTEFVLIISSHVLMQDSRIIEQCFSYDELRDENCLGACFYPSPNMPEGYALSVIDRFNLLPNRGFSNSCAMVKKSFIDQRNFREEVFSAEDQEWAAYYLRKSTKNFIAINCNKLLYLNKKVNDLKKVNEIVAMAMFAFPELLEVKSLLKFLRLSFRAIKAGDSRNFVLNLKIVVALLVLRFKKIKRKSAYY